ncbi:MAG: hypothetical protein H6Q20_1771 [Bacteroidetes bacterium]|nr:hypothetical protein [Bacteroidota bacterium]
MAEIKNFKPGERKKPATKGKTTGQDRIILN